LARRFRQEATEAERRLWGILRNKQFAGLRFRRQQPIGPFVVDFYCSAARLIVELDGGQHADPARAPATTGCERAGWNSAVIGFCGFGTGIS
jgi:very-short-patch-repair endonuclease